MPACHVLKDCSSFDKPSIEKPSPRMMHASASMGLKKPLMVIFGGVGGGNIPLNDLWLFSAGKWTFIDPASDKYGPGDGPPRARSLMSMSALGPSSVMIFGGINWQNKPLDDIWQVSIDAGEESADGSESKWQFSSHIETEQRFNFTSVCAYLL